jgi:tripartite-type tricarboxylate transporter receptor subunit TctC
MSALAGDDVTSFMRQTRLVVPFPPGGSTAYTADMLAAAMRREFGAPVRLDYQIGDYGLNALRTLVHAPDGNLLMIGSIITASMTPVLRSDDMDFDFVDRVAPVTKVAEFPSILMTSLSVPVEDVFGLLEFCRQRDGVLKYGSDFLGTFVDIDVLEMARRSGLTAAYHETVGALGVLNALIEGKVDMVMMNVATATANRGKYKPLAVSGPRRLTGFPNVPTMTESGFDGVGVMQWQGLFVSRRLRSELVDDLHKSIVQVMNTAAARSAMAAVDAAVVTSASPAQFGAEVEREMARWVSMKAQILALPRA